MNIPIFIINLPRDPERKEFMGTQMDKLALSHEFVTGFTGHDENVMKSCDDEMSSKYNNSVLTKGEKGCAYSHRYIYEKMVIENIRCALIMEDDAILPNDFKEILEKEVNRKNKNWDWLSFEYPTGVPFIKKWIKVSINQIKARPILAPYIFLKFFYIFFLFLYEYIRDLITSKFEFLSGPKIFLRPLYHASNYLITKEGAKKLIALSDPIIFSADRLPNQARIKNGFVLRGYTPLIAKQNKNFESRVV